MKSNEISLIPGRQLPVTNNNSPLSDARPLGCNQNSVAANVGYRKESFLTHPQPQCPVLSALQGMGQTASILKPNQILRYAAYILIHTLAGETQLWQLMEQKKMQVEGRVDSQSQRRRAGPDEAEGFQPDPPGFQLTSTQNKA